MTREAVVMVIIIVGAVIFNIIVEFIIFTIYSGRGVRGGLGEAVAVGNCGGEGCNGNGQSF